MSQNGQNMPSPVDARHPDPGRVAVGPGQGGLCQAAWLTVTVKPLADPEKVRLIRRYGGKSQSTGIPPARARTSFMARLEPEVGLGPPCYRWAPKKSIRIGVITSGGAL
jgi:hypothetical protein